MEGNDRFEGYSKDLMTEIAKELHFKFQLEIVSGLLFAKSSWNLEIHWMNIFQIINMDLSIIKPKNGMDLLDI